MYSTCCRIFSCEVRNRDIAWIQCVCWPLLVQAPKGLQQAKGCANAGCALRQSATYSDRSCARKFERVVISATPLFGP